jgi:hypothetical protein
LESSWLQFHNQNYQISKLKISHLGHLYTYLENLTDLSFTFGVVSKMVTKLLTKVPTLKYLNIGIWMKSYARITKILHQHCQNRTLNVIIGHVAGIAKTYEPLYIIPPNVALQIYFDISLDDELSTTYTWLLIVITTLKIKDLRWSFERHATNSFFQSLFEEHRFDYQLLYMSPAIVLCNLFTNIIKNVPKYHLSMNKDEKLFVDQRLKEIFEQESDKPRHPIFQELIVQSHYI